MDHILDSAHQKRTSTPVIDNTTTITIHKDKCNISSIPTNNWSLSMEEEEEDHVKNTKTPLKKRNPVVVLIWRRPPFNVTADRDLLKRTSARPEINTGKFAMGPRQQQSMLWLEIWTMANREEGHHLERSTLLLWFRCQWQDPPNVQWSSSSTTSPHPTRVSRRDISTRRHHQSPCQPHPRRLRRIPVGTTTLTTQRCSCSSREPFPHCTAAWTATRQSRIAGTTRTFIGLRATRVRSVARSLLGGTIWRHTARLSTRTCALRRPVAHQLRLVSITGIRVISRTLFKCDKMEELRGRREIEAYKLNINPFMWFRGASGFWVGAQ